MYLHEEETSLFACLLVVQGPGFWDHVHGILSFILIDSLDQLTVGYEDGFDRAERLSIDGAELAMPLVAVLVDFRGSTAGQQLQSGAKDGQSRRSRYQLVRLDRDRLACSRLVEGTTGFALGR